MGQNSVMMLPAKVASVNEELRRIEQEQAKHRHALASAFQLMRILERMDEPSKLATGAAEGTIFQGETSHLIEALRSLIMRCKNEVDIEKARSREIDAAIAQKRAVLSATARMYGMR